MPQHRFPRTGVVDALTVRGRVAASRALFGPHVTNLGHRRGLSERHVAYYARRAVGGTGVVVVETASVHPSDHPYERAPLAADCGPGWAAIAAACRPSGALVIASLGHAGAQGSTAHTRDALWGASPVADPGTREVPVPMGQAEIDALVTGFAAAAAAAVAADLDGVEVEAGQHALLRQFRSGLTNHRDDGYGRDRDRLLREVLGAVRAALGPGRVLGLRLGVDELAPWGGVVPDDPLPDLAGVDYLVPVRGCALSVGATRPDAHAPAPDLTGPVRRAAAGRPLPGLVRQGGVVDPATAQAALGGGCVLVEMTRALVADPDLVAHLRAGTPERVRPCTLTNRRFDVRDPRNPIVSDDAEPRSGHETVDPPLPTALPGRADEVLVVGGGPGGLEAARTLALLGWRVRLVERSDGLGGALRWAALLPGRGRFALLLAWWEAELARLGVTVERGREVTEADLAGACAAVLATGGRPGPVEQCGDGPVLDAATFLARWDAGSVGLGAARALPVRSQEDGPGPVVVHDPLPDGTGTALAELVARAGRPTVLVTPDPVAAADSPGDLAPANTRLERLGVERAVLSRLVTVGDGAAVLEHVWTGARRAVPCTLVVDAGYRLPADALGRARPDLPRAGDCVAPRSVHEAVREGRRAALALARP